MNIFWFIFGTEEVLAMNLHSNFSFLFLCLVLSPRPPLDAHLLCHILLEQSWYILEFMFRTDFLQFVET